MDRRSEFKFHGLTQEELRKKREETTVQLRQTRREEALQKRRFTGNAGAGSSMMMADDMLASEPASSMAGLPSQSQLREKLAELSRTLQTSMELATLHNVAHSIRNILSREQSPPIQEAIDSGCVPRLVQLLKLVYADCPVTYDPGQLSLEEQAALKEKIVFEAAWALTNVASGKPTQTAVVVETEAPLLFSQLLDHPNPDICEQSIWALGNIAGDGPPHRDLLLVSMNLVGKVLRLLERELQSPTAHAMMIRNATWLLSNLARGKPSPRCQPVPSDICALAMIYSSRPCRPCRSCC
jgi:importin subunit alpha-6/7